jgi:hypothetical protein
MAKHLRTAQQSQAQVCICTAATNVHNMISTRRSCRVLPSLIFLMAKKRSTSTAATGSLREGRAGVRGWERGGRGGQVWPSRGRAKRWMPPSERFTVG